MKNLHYIPHTHWDREWHKTFEAFRVRLAYSMEIMLDTLENDKNFSYFMYDAQTSILDDYLTVYPENKDRLKKLISDKRMFVGPWYTQPDFYLISGESLVRNLLIGSNIADDMGHSMEIGYIPDSFGQAAQLPQILNGFDLKSVLVWRGIARDDIDDSVFSWQSPDGSKILGIHFPLGYGYNRYLPADKEKAVEKILDTEKILADRFKDGEIMLMGGGDHTAIQKGLPDIIDYANQYFKENNYDLNIKISNPELLTESIKNALKTNNRKLQTLHGELRNPKEQRVHFGDSSSRMDIKYLSKNLEHKISSVIEPLSTIASLEDGFYSNGLINKSWKYLFENQAHDSICTCCTDESHDDIMNRFKYSQQINRELENMFYRYMERELDLSLIKGRAVLLVNTLPYKRENFIEITVYTKEKEFSIYSSTGKKIPYEVISSVKTDLSETNISLAMDIASENYILDSYSKNPKYIFYENKIIISADFLPAAGYEVIDIRENETAGSNDKLVFSSENHMENKYFKINIEENGSLTILEKAGQKQFSALIYEEKGDDGDEYDYSPPKNDKVFTTENLKAEINKLYENNFETAFEIKHIMSVPKSLNNDRLHRSSNLTELKITSTVRLRADSKTIDIKTKINNNSCDHIIKVLSKAPVNVQSSYAGDHFSVIERSNYIPVPDNWKELDYKSKPLPIYPMQGFADISDGKTGLAVLSTGLPEYEIYNDNTIALTLMRSVGKMGKSNLEIRPGRVSGIEFDTPDSQMNGEYEFEFAIAPHLGDYSNAQIQRLTSLYSTPVSVKQFLEDIKTGKRALRKEYIELIGNNIEVSALKKSERDKNIIVRLFNPSQNISTDNKLKINFPHSSVSVTNLKETADLGNLKLSDDLYILPDLKNAEILTLKITL
jgi:mannosylglycerate hydrolase